MPITTLKEPSSHLLLVSRFRIDPRQRMIHRTPVKIHFPLRTLKTTALWQTVKLLSNTADIDELEIPKSLRFELTNLFEKYQRHRDQPVPNDEQDPS